MVHETTRCRNCGQQMTLIMYKVGQNTETFEVCECGDQYYAITHHPIEQFASTIEAMRARRQMDESIAQDELDALIREIEANNPPPSS